MLAIVDAGPLYASLDSHDQDHVRSLETLRRPDLQLVILALVVAEVCYLVSVRLGPDAEATFVGGLSGLHVEAPLPDEWPRIAELMQQHRDFPLGAADASVTSLAERIGTDLVVTLDQRHFRTIRPRHCLTFRLLPGDM